MTVSRALGRGFSRSTREFRLTSILYSMNLFLAIPLALAFRSALRASFGDSMAIEVLLKDFDSTVYSDFMKYSWSRISSFFPQILWLTLSYMFVNALTAGGVLGHLADDRSFSLTGFLENCGKYFGRMIRLLLFALVVVVVAGLLWFMILGGVFAAVSADAASEKTLFIWFLVVTVVYLFPFMLFIMASDYARISVVFDDETKMFKLYWRSLGFVLRNFFTTVGLQLSILLILAVAIVIYWLIESGVGMSSGIAIAAMFVVQQLFLFFKVWTRVWTFSGEVELVKIRKEPPRAPEMSFTPPPSVAPSLPPVLPAPEPMEITGKRVRKTQRRRKATKAPRKKMKR